MTLHVNEDIILELTAQKHAAGLMSLVDNNRLHLSRFLGWVDKMQTVKDFEGYIQHCELLYEGGTDISFVIFYKAEMAGRIGLHYIHPQNKLGSIGYWLGSRFEGKGIIIESCRKIIEFGFGQLHLNRIEIKAAVENVRSQAIPEKLLFNREGMLRQAEFVKGKALDLYLYALIKEDWLKNIQALR